MPNITRLFRDQRGATAVEYGLIAALIVIAMIAAMNLFAGSTIEMWNYVSGSMTNVTDDAD